MDMSGVPGSCAIVLEMARVCANFFFRDSLMPARRHPGQRDIQPEQTGNGELRPNPRTWRRLIPPAFADASGQATPAIIIGPFSVNRQS